MTFAFKRFAWAATGAGMLLVSATGVAFAETVVSGNGAFSHNTVQVSNDCSVGVSQHNTTNALTDVVSVASTGGNTVAHNTGGDAAIGTGDGTSTVSVTVLGGSNGATAPSCCDCAQTPVDTAVTDNGVKSHNKVQISSIKVQVAKQKSKTVVTSFVSSKVATGKNKLKGNTGSGAGVITGGSDSSVEVGVVGGTNVLE